MNLNLQLSFTPLMRNEMEITQSVWCYYDEDEDEIYFDEEGMIEEFQMKMQMLIEMKLLTKKELKKYFGF